MARVCKISIIIFIQCCLIFGLTNYGGVRAPDSEIVFRSAESFARQGSFFVASDLESWPAFGVARGRDGRQFSVYPPGEMLLLSAEYPVIEKISAKLLPFAWKIPISHYVGNDLELDLRGEQISKSPEHQVRFVASFLDVGISALGVVVFWLVVLKLTGSVLASYLVSSMYAFATPVWSYAGALFSEPLAALFMLLSVLLLLMRGPAAALAAGFLLGMSTVTHVTAILFAPFFALYRYGLPRTRSAYFDLLNWCTGLGLVLSLLGYYNWIRFGSFFESGRGLSVDNQVHFVSVFSEQSIINTSNLLFSPGKGLFILCPAALLGVLLWRYLHRADPRLSILLLAAIILRVGFTSLYVDWHAGFGLGPRYLYLAFPFFLLPCAYWLKAHLSDFRTLLRGAVLLWLCVIEQWYLVLGEVFSFYHRINASESASGNNVFLHDRIYTEWQFSPLMHLLDYQRGPFLLKAVSLSNQALWAVGALVWLVAILGGVYLVRKRVSVPFAEQFSG